MAIFIIDGYPGNGKSAYAVRWIVDRLKNGEIVFSDIKLNPEEMKKWVWYWQWPFLRYECFLPNNCEGDINKAEDRINPDKRILYWKHFAEWNLMKSGTIFCDEGGVKFNSRKWEGLGEEIQNKLMQHRHDKLDLILTAPHWTRIDVLIRQLCERFLHVELKLGSKEFKTSWIPRLAKVSEHYLEDMIRMENLGKDSVLVSDPIYSEWFWISQKVMNYYDTGEIVGSSNPPPLIHKLLTCVTCGFSKVNHS